MEDIDADWVGEYYVDGDLGADFQLKITNYGEYEIYKGFFSGNMAFVARIVCYNA